MVKPEVTKKILADAEQYVPGISQARIVAEFTGLRPGRTQIRLEEEEVVVDVSDSNSNNNNSNKRTVRIPVIHNYGHGGSGVTLSWGCAKEVVERAAKHTNNSQRTFHSKL